VRTVLSENLTRSNDQPEKDDGTAKERVSHDRFPFPYDQIPWMPAAATVVIKRVRKHCF
jgi:hypothetical protein